LWNLHPLQHQPADPACQEKQRIVLMRVLVMFPSDFDDSRRLDRLFVCQECKSAFLFPSDAKEHFARTGHKGLTVLPIDSDD
jgi:hypothetical protein